MTLPPSPSPPAWWRETRAVVHLAAPLALTHLSYMAIMLTDVVMMGWIGTGAIAAGSLARDFFWVLDSFALGVLAARDARSWPSIWAPAGSADQARDAQRRVARASAGGPHLRRRLVLQSDSRAPGSEQHVADDGQSYLRYLLWGLLPALWFAVLTEFLAAHARPRAVFAVTLFGIALNALLDYTLMFGNSARRRWGWKAPAWRALVVSWFMFLALLAFVLRDRQFRRYRLLGRPWRVEWSVMSEIVRVGSPIAVTEVAEMGMFFVTTLMMGLLGVEALGGPRGDRPVLRGVVFMIPVGLAQAGAVRVGRAAGARDAVAVARAGWTATGAGGPHRVPAIRRLSGSPAGPWRA